jgi:3-hydroxyacyl-CoA dehydrogenase
MKQIRKVAVLGAGTMGSRIAAHIANAGVPVVLLDMAPPGTPADAGAAARNKLALAALDGLKKSQAGGVLYGGLGAVDHAGQLRR